MSLRVSCRISPVVLVAILFSIVFISAWKTARSSSKPSKALSGSLLLNADHPLQCKERNLLCCKGVDNPRRPLVKDLLALLNVTIDGPAPTGDASSTGLVGVRCASTNVFGAVAEGYCSGRILCCDYLTKDARIATGCDTLDLGFR
ncbi:hypothetical protein CPB83DRAFT_909916 [Crepidotus variabilis]|uniref:Hydrophobin n=1 Tax=Crepidotus variabilis TaxID=179855 RepID=A0A9P6E8S7_9AGAR|nr:hypothetical protein CPB83DRAFT_909916 [Crepidotus variabilis]